MTKKVMKKTNFLVISMVVMFLLACTFTVTAQRVSEVVFPLPQETFRIAVLGMSQETCTYCPAWAGVDEWGKPTDKKVSLGSGFERQIAAYGGVELVGILSCSSPPGGSSRSWNTKESWDYVTGIMMKDLEEKGPFDGAILKVHGALAVSGVARPEAELARLVRSVIGDDAIIAIDGFDLHANEDAELVKPLGEVDILDGNKRYPHYDSYLASQRVADIMIRTLRGDFKPVIAVRKPGILSPSFFQGTTVQPASEVYERARRWENQHKDLYITMNMGFAYADVPDNGLSIFVLTNDDQELADRVADDMNSYWWARRKALALKEIYDVEDGVARTIEAVKAGEIPVIVADGCDRTGGATQVTNELIKQGASNFAISTLADPALILELAGRGLKVGDKTGPIAVAGTTDKFSGDPVYLDDAVIEYMDDSYIVLGFGDNNHIWVSSRLRQVTSPEWHKKYGFDDPVNQFDILVHKTRVHFYRGYYETQICGEGYPGTIVMIEVPGWGPATVTKMDFKNGAQYLYPFVMDREMGDIWDRPYIGVEDMVFETGEGVVVP